MGIAGFFIWLTRHYVSAIEPIGPDVVTAAEGAKIMQEQRFAREAEARAVAATELAQRQASGECDDDGQMFAAGSTDEDAAPQLLDNRNNKNNTNNRGGAAGGYGRERYTGPPRRFGPVPTFDSLYLDMNGLIHPCCHHTAPVPEPESEEEMFVRIFQQVDQLMAIARPRKILFMAVDGVAPRSKMNQQRARRFRAATERAEASSIAADMAEVVQKLHHLPVPPNKERWDHNVITPSTPFMERVGQILEWYILKRLNSDDPLWKDLTVILSDAHVPGEGEHKIMHYIRALRQEEDYDPMTHHLISGMDADLIVLGAVTHELNFSVLRNRLDNETKQPVHDKYCVFSVRKFRNLLEKDFGNLGERMNFERVMDDFVYLCFFIGNDFLPHMPLLEIKQRGIETMLDHYVNTFDKGNYLTKNGEIMFNRLRIFLETFIEQKYQELLELHDEKQKYVERARLNMETRLDGLNRDIQGWLSQRKPDHSNDQEIGEKVYKCYVDTATEQKKFVGGQFQAPFEYGGPDYREKYYMSKFGWTAPLHRHDFADQNEEMQKQQEEQGKKSSRNKNKNNNNNNNGAGTGGTDDEYYLTPEQEEQIRRSEEEFEAQVARCCREYLQGMQWVMRYYTVGVPSWSWYYPYYFAPLLEDVSRYCFDVSVDFKLSEPLHPVHQLLSVLPQESYLALPAELHDHVLQPKSALAGFYPKSIEVDFTEATFNYQGVIKLPFIKVEKLVRVANKIFHAEPDVGSSLVFTRNDSQFNKFIVKALKYADRRNNNNKQKNDNKKNQEKNRYGNDDEGAAEEKDQQITAPASTNNDGEGGAVGARMRHIPAVAIRQTPISGRIGHFEFMWPQNVDLDCPDRGFETYDKTEGAPIRRNKVIAYKYEMNMHTPYIPELLVRDTQSTSNQQYHGHGNDNKLSGKRREHRGEY